MELISLFHQSPDILIIHLVKALMEFWYLFGLVGFDLLLHLAR